MPYERALDILNYAATREPAPEAAFVWRGGWVVRKALLGAALLNPANPLHRLFGLPTNRLLGLAFAGGKTLPLPLAADAVQLRRGGDRVRSFHFASGTTVKYVREGCKLGDITANEAPVRFAVQQLGCIPVPELLSAERQGGFLILREKQIAARRFHYQRDRALFLPQVVAPLRRLYDASGITRRPLTDTLEPAFLAQLAGRGDALLPLIARNPLVATALCHNDAVQSNLAVGREGQVYFLDWGIAAPGLAGRDFLRIGHRYTDATIQAGLDHHLRDLHEGTLTLADMLALQQALRAYQPF